MRAASAHVRSFFLFCLSFIFSSADSAVVLLPCLWMHSCTALQWRTGLLLIKWLTSHLLFVELQRADDKRKVPFSDRCRAQLSRQRAVSLTTFVVRPRTWGLICYRRVSILGVVAVVGPCREGLVFVLLQQDNKPFRNATKRSRGKACVQKTHREWHIPSCKLVGVHARGFLNTVTLCPGIYV